MVAKYDNMHGPLNVGALAGHVKHSRSFNPRAQMSLLAGRSLQRTIQYRRRAQGASACQEADRMAESIARRAKRQKKGGMREGGSRGNTG